MEPGNADHLRPPISLSRSTVMPSKSGASPMCVLPRAPYPRPGPHACAVRNVRRQGIRRDGSALCLPVANEVRGTAESATGDEPRITRASVGLRSERGPILLSLMLSTSLVALDSTIIATAVPALVRDLGGFAQFPWLFSIYVLAQAASTPSTAGSPTSSAAS